MTDRTVSLEYLEDLPEILPPPGRYTTPEDDQDAFTGLLWSEVKRIEKEAHMTDWQAVVWEWHLRGFNNCEIGRVFQRTEGNIRLHLAAATEKALKCPYRGLLTVMVEELGWPSVKELFADQEESVADKRRRREVMESNRCNRVKVA